MVFRVLLLLFIGSSIAQTADPSAGGWKQISNIPVCVKARGEGYGHLLYYGESKLVGALKLKYESGELRCTNNEAYNSRWGCANRKNPLNIIITDESNHVIFPLPEYIKENGMWYYMPLVNEVYSDELVFADFGHPLYLKQDDRLRFWYGEDLTKYASSDNQGQVCFHVLALFI